MEQVKQGDSVTVEMTVDQARLIRDICGNTIFDGNGPGVTEMQAACVNLFISINDKMRYVEDPANKGGKPSYFASLKCVGIKSNTY